jgi:hypothetical protein
MFAEVVVAVNAPPRSGYLDISPRRGSALETIFTLSAVGWTDHPDDLPLRYAFTYDEKKWLSSAFIPRSTLRTVLPSGELPIEAHILDNRGAAAVFRTTAFVSEPSPDAVTSALNSGSLSNLLFLSTMNIVRKDNLLQESLKYFEAQRGSPELYRSRQVLDQQLALLELVVSAEESAIQHAEFQEILDHLVWLLTTRPSMETRQNAQRAVGILSLFLETFVKNDTVSDATQLMSITFARSAMENAVTGEDPVHITFDNLEIWAKRDALSNLEWIPGLRDKYGFHL